MESRRIGMVVRFGQRRRCGVGLGLGRERRKRVLPRLSCEIAAPQKKSWRSQRSTSRAACATSVAVENSDSTTYRGKQRSGEYRASKRTEGHYKTEHTAKQKPCTSNTTAKPCSPYPYPIHALYDFLHTSLSSSNGPSSSFPPFPPSPPSSSSSPYLLSPHTCSCPASSLPSTSSSSSTLNGSSKL